MFICLLDEKMSNQIHKMFIGILAVHFDQCDSHRKTLRGYHARTRFKLRRQCYGTVTDFFLVFKYDIS